MFVILSLLLSAPPARAQEAGDDPEQDVGPVDLGEPTTTAPAPKARWHLWLEPELGLALHMGHPGLGSAASLDRKSVV